MRRGDWDGVTPEGLRYRVVRLVPTSERLEQYLLRANHGRDLPTRSADPREDYEVRH